MKHSRLSSPYIVWMIIFIVVPLLMVVFLSFTVKDAAGGYTLSLHNLNKFMSPMFLKVLGKSLMIAFWSTIACLIIGYPAAYILAKTNFKRSSVFLLLIILPMWINMLLRTYSWMTLLENSGHINNFLSFLGFGQVQLMYNDGAILLGMVYNFLPFMILPIYSVLVKIDNSLLEAARDLGASDMTTLRKVVFPLSLGGVYSGCIMVFVPAMSSFVIPRLLSGGKIMLIGNAIEQQFLKTGDWNFGSFLALILMILVMLSLFFIDLDNMEDSSII